MLRHKSSDLIGSNIEEIIVPKSREAIRRLIQDLVIAEQRAVTSAEGREGNGRGNGNSQEYDGGGGGENEIGGNEESGREDGRNDSGVSSSTVIISEHSSEQSFPLLEVKVKAGQTSTEVAAGEDVSDSSGDPPSKNGKVRDINGTAATEMSSLTNKNSSFGPESITREDNGLVAQSPSKKAKTTGHVVAPPSPEKNFKTNSTESDESTTSENKNARKASINLSRNVQMCKEATEQVHFSHKDDVMGASVTANNADAKLSSLMHYPTQKEETDYSIPLEQVASIRRKHVLAQRGTTKEEQSSSSADSSLSKIKKSDSRSGNSSEDSGYRESNESPEESNEYPEDSSSSSASFDCSSKKKREYFLLDFFSVVLM